MSQALAKGVTLSSITVSDLDNAKHLFCDLLGLKLVKSDEQYAWLEIEGEMGARLGVGQENPECLDPDAPSAPAHNAVVSIEVNNIEQAKEHLEANKVKFIGEIMEIPGDVKLAHFLDFDGNHFFLAQQLN